MNILYKIILNTALLSISLYTSKHQDNDNIPIISAEFEQHSKKSYIYELKFKANCMYSQQ
jgi:hypothetical protein